MAALFPLMTDTPSSCYGRSDFQIKIWNVALPPISVLMSQEHRKAHGISQLLGFSHTIILEQITLHKLQLHESMRLSSLGLRLCVLPIEFLPTNVFQGINDVKKR
jgi:hypothetical protein